MPALNSGLALTLLSAGPDRSVVGPSKGNPEVIVIGIDPHKKIHIAVAAADNGRLLGDALLPARQRGLERDAW
jgi:hypothetical protein